MILATYNLIIYYHVWRHVIVRAATASKAHVTVPRITDLCVTSFNRAVRAREVIKVGRIAVERTSIRTQSDTTHCVVVGGYLRNRKGFTDSTTSSTECRKRAIVGLSKNISPSALKINVAY